MPLALPQKTKSATAHFETTLSYPRENTHIVNNQTSLSDSVFYYNVMITRTRLIGYLNGEREKGEWDSDFTTEQTP